MKQKIGYAAVVFLAGMLYLWTNTAVTCYLFLGLLLAALVSWALNQYAAGHLTLQLAVAPEKDEIHSIRIVVANTGFIPCFRVVVKGRLLNCLTDSTQTFVRELSAPPRQQKTLQLAVQSRYCGRLEAEIPEFKSCDFLGVFSKTIKIREVAVNYAYPDEMEKTGNETEEAAPALQNTENRYLRRKGNDITEILDLRDYQKGDSIKTIHWKLSKKLGHKVVRELDTPANQEIMLLFALSEENIDKPEYRDAIVQRISSISHELLESDKMFDGVIFEKEGMTHSRYSVEEIYTRELYERTILDGNISFMQSPVDDYMIHHNVLHKYSSVILITDAELSGWCVQHPNVRQVVVAAS